MKKKIALLLLVLMVLGGGFFAGKAYVDSRRYVTTDDARIEGDLATVSPEIAGKLTDLHVKEGDEVAPGETLARLEEKNTDWQHRDAALVKSPARGVVVKMFASEGENVSPGQRLMVVADLREVYVFAQVEETKIERVAVGQPVRIDVDAYPDRPLEGIVEQVGLAAESAYSLLPSTNASGNYIKVTQRIPVKIKLLETRGLKLLPGMNVVVRIDVGGSR